MGTFERLHAALYDPVLRTQERRWLGTARRQLVARAHGTVLELGAGTGANLDHLDAAPPELTTWIATEPSRPMVDRLRTRAEVGAATASPVDVRVERMSAEALAYPDASIDTVVSTLVLCTVPRLDVALGEIRRVLRPGGRLLLLEHVAADGTAGRAQRVLAPVWELLGRGCRLDRSTVDHLAAAGFDVADVGPVGAAPSTPLLPIVAGAALVSRAAGPGGAAQPPGCSAAASTPSSDRPRRAPA